MASSIEANRMNRSTAGRLPRGASLEALSGVAGGAGCADIAAEARALAERVREGRFYVVGKDQSECVKFTLLNVLIGQFVREHLARNDDPRPCTEALLAQPGKEG